MGTAIIFIVLIVLGVLAAIGFILIKKRDMFMKRGMSKQRKDSGFDPSSGDSEIEHKAVVVEQTEKPAQRNNNSFLNLQSVTIQTNQRQGTQPTSVGKQNQTPLMREMSTELEKKLEDRVKKGEPSKQKYDAGRQGL